MSAREGKATSQREGGKTRRSERRGSDTDADAPPLGPDKYLSTLGTLDEAALLAAMHEQAEGVLPGPCVYEMTAWAVEHALEFVRTQWA